MSCFNSFLIALFLIFGLVSQLEFKFSVAQNKAQHFNFSCKLGGGKSIDLFCLHGRPISNDSLTKSNTNHLERDNKNVLFLKKITDIAFNEEESNENKNGESVIDLKVDFNHIYSGL